MGGLRNTSRVLQNLGNLHMIQGRVIYTSGVPSLSGVNDATVTVADTGTGNCTLTFDAFNAAPSVVANALKATHDAADQDTVTIEAITTTTAEFRFLLTNDAGAASNVTSPDPADNDGCSFLIVGLRNN